ncbi:Imm10 family immunity protein [Comamonas sp. GB3 AK4-5]|uniref:Imm10 family immunity protein n=1 Tax=Comamonas sp. GB3 AK4-5 TaxID=3231487 RepID=UPI00351EFD71
MQHLIFDAHCIALEHPEGLCHLVGLADSEFDTHNYVMLQRDWESDAHDRALGMDSYHAEYGGAQRAGGYGGLVRCVLTPQAMQLVFAPSGPQAAGGVGSMDIRYQLDAARYAALHQALALIFAGTDCLQVRAA